MNFVAALDEEIDALERSIRERPDPRLVKLQELQRVRALYKGDANSPASAPDARPVEGFFKYLEDAHKVARKEPKRASGRRASPQRQRALDTAKGILKGESEPMKTSALYKRLVERGIAIGGQNPANNLSAMLHHSPDFVSHGRTGWTLAETGSAEPESEKAVDDDPGGNPPTALSDQPSAQGG